MKAETEITRFGFTYGPMTVERIGESPSGHVATYVTGGQGHGIEVYVSPKGRSIRVFDMDGKELKA